MAKTKLSVTATDITESWVNKTKQAGPRIMKGIDAVTENPATKAVAQEDKMRTNWNRAMDEGKWRNALGKVTLADWKARTKNGVQTSLSAGVEAARTKYASFAQWLVNRENAILPTIAAMPSTTLQDNINRMVAWVTAMSEQSYKAGS